MKKTKGSLAAVIIFTMLFVLGISPFDLRAFAAGQPPVITYPAEGQVVDPGSLTVTWDAVPGADMYSCLLWDLTRDQNGGQWGSFGTSTTFTVLEGR